MATDLDEMLGTDDEEETRPKPKPEDEESLAPAVGAPTAQPLIPPPSMSAIPAPEMPMSGNDPATNPLAALGSPAQPAPPAAAVASPMDRYNALHAAGAPVSHKTGFGGGLLKGLDVAGNIIVPGVMANIPGTTMHQKFAEQSALNAGKQGEAEQATQANLAHTQAETGKLGAETDALKNPQPKPKEEDWTVVPGIQGPNGEPVQQEKNSGTVRVAPLAGASLVDKTKQNPAHVTYDSGIPVSVVGQDGKVYDVNDPKLPPELKPLVDAANRAHGQHVTEDTNKQANAAALAAPKQENTRSDKSYQFNSTQLEKVRDPVDKLSGRLGNLESSLNQNTPQADALIAPELLSIMAGGAGSGLRMNESEIARIVGGRSNWESLQAAINKWKLDPKAANSITQPQREQIRALYGAVQQKVAAKQKILEDAEGKLLESDDPKDHRRIVAEARKQLDAVDAAAQGAGGGKTYTDAEVQAAAKAHNMKPEDIEKSYKDKGYTKK